AESIKQVMFACCYKFYYFLFRRISIHADNGSHKSTGFGGTENRSIGPFIQRLPLIFATPVCELIFVAAGLTLQVVFIVWILFDHLRSDNLFFFSFGFLKIDLFLAFFICRYSD